MTRPDCSPIREQISWHHYGGIFLLSLATLVLELALTRVLSVLFTRGAAGFNRWYACDLVGAGVGCAMIALVIPTFGGSGAIVIAAVLGLLAAVVFGLRWARGLALAGAVLGITMFGIACIA